MLLGGSYVAGEGVRCCLEGPTVEGGGVWFVAAVGSIDAGCWESYYCWWESIVAGSQGILLQGIILSLAAEDLFYCFSYYH